MAQSFRGLVTSAGSVYQTIVTDVRGVCLSVTQLKSVAARAVYAVCAGSFGAAFVKLLWPVATCYL